jgi:hypothetical protein
MDVIYKDCIKELPTGTSTHFKIRDYLIEIEEDVERISVVGDLIIKNGDSEEVIASNYYSLADEFGLSKEELIKEEVNAS